MSVCVCVRMGHTRRRFKDLNLVLTVQTGISLQMMCVHLGDPRASTQNDSKTQGESEVTRGLVGPARAAGCAHPAPPPRVGLGAGEAEHGARLPEPFIRRAWRVRELISCI